MTRLSTALTGETPRPVVGILGGFGHRAGAAFYTLLTDKSAGPGAGGHRDVVLVSPVGVPDRGAHLLHGGPSPLPQLVAALTRLEGGGAEVLAIPSATVHAYWDSLVAATALPIVSLVTATAHQVAALGVRRVALLGSTVTARLGLFTAALPETDLLVPDPSSQAGVQSVIDALKAGAAGSRQAERIASVLRRPWAHGHDAVLLGCTELNLIARQLELQTPVVDAADALADALLRATHRPAPRS